VEGEGNRGARVRGAEEGRTKREGGKRLGRAEREKRGLAEHQPAAVGTSHIRFVTPLALIGRFPSHLPCLFRLRKPPIRFPVFGAFRASQGTQLFHCTAGPPGASSGQQITRAYADSSVCGRTGTGNTREVGVVKGHRGATNRDAAAGLSVRQRPPSHSTPCRTVHDGSDDPDWEQWEDSEPVPTKSRRDGKPPVPVRTAREPRSLVRHLRTPPPVCVCVLAAACSLFLFLCARCKDVSAREANGNGQKQGGREQSRAEQNRTAQGSEGRGNDTQDRKRQTGALLCFAFRWAVAWPGAAAEEQSVGGAAAPW
jgi:hypothetical protein